MTNYTARRRGAPLSHGRRHLCRSPSSSSSGSSSDLPPLTPEPEELDHKLAIGPSMEYDEDSDVPRWRGRLQPRPSVMNSPKRPTQNAPIQRQQQSYSDDDESMEDPDSDYEMSESGESAIDADKRSLKVISHDATAHRRDIKTYDLDFAMDYKFKRGEPALVKCFGRWYHGQILKPYRDPQRPQVPSYDVFFRDEWNRLRAVATPLDGCLKPDTLELRQLFEEAGVEIYSRC